MLSCVADNAVVERGFMKLDRYSGSNCGGDLISYIYTATDACYGAFDYSERVSCNSDDV